MLVEDEEPPFPCPVGSLDEHAREIWDTWQASLRNPGDVVAYRYHSTPARVHFWPESSDTDQRIARSISEEWGFIVPHDSLFLIVCEARPDALGNSWYEVIVDGRLGYLPASDTSDPQEYIDARRAHEACHGAEVTGHEIGRRPLA